MNGLTRVLNDPEAVELVLECSATEPRTEAKRYLAQQLASCTFSFNVELIQGNRRIALAFVLGKNVRPRQATEQNKYQGEPLQIVQFKPFKKCACKLFTIRLLKAKFK